ncbi:hypothetical protein AOLI_G00114290 [Acnodon oligacanthus]
MYTDLERRGVCVLGESPDGGVDLQWTGLPRLAPSRLHEASICRPLPHSAALGLTPQRLDEEVTAGTSRPTHPT